MMTPTFLDQTALAKTLIMMSMDYLLLYRCARPNYSRSQPRRLLDDEHLDSGDDVDRNDRAGDRIDYEDGAGEEPGATLNIMDLSLARAPAPAATDGEVCAQFRHGTAAAGS